MLGRLSNWVLTGKLRTSVEIGPWIAIFRLRWLEPGLQRVCRPSIYLSSVDVCGRNMKFLATPRTTGRAPS